MTVVNRIVLCALLALCGAWQAVAASSVFALPESTFEPNVPYFGVSPFQGPNTLAAAPGVVAVLAKPDGSKFYVVSASTTDTLLVMDGSLSTVLRRVSLSQAATAAVLSPDGKRLLVLAGGLHVFDTTTASDDEITLSPVPDVGLNPNDVAVSIDSRRAFIISDASDQFTVFDLTTNLVAGSQLTITGALTGVAVAPSGLVYVSGTNRLYEFDPYSGNRRGEIGLNATPAKPVFTPDGKYAVLANTLPVQFNDGVATLVDLQTRSKAATIPAAGSNLGVKIDHLTVIDSTRLFAVSTNNQRLVVVKIEPFELQSLGFPLDTRTGILAAKASGELPGAKYLFAATTNTMSRVVIASSQAADLTLPKMPKRLVAAGPSSTATPAGFQKFNDGQNVVGGSTTQPLIVQIWDANGVPVMGRAVQFSTTFPGATIETANSTTNVNGQAATRVTVPETPGTVTVTANVNGLASPIDFEIIVAGGGGGGGGGGGISIFSGNGQIVPRGFPTTLPLKVLVRDAQGQPIIGAKVDWKLIGQGILSPPAGIGGETASTDTDIDGVTFLTYVGPSFIPPTTSWVQATVEATASGLNTVTFTVTAVPNLPDGNPAIPTLLLTKPPEGNRQLSGQAGQTLSDGIEFTVNAIAGFQSGQGIPGISVEIERPADPATTPSASCADPTRLSDVTGVGKCDVVFGGAIGTGPAKVILGGLREFFVTIQVNPGVPGLVKILGGNNQSGDPGQTLPVQLKGEVSDGFGHLLANVPVTWEVVVPGTVTITNASTTSNALGQVSATAQLGGTPGPVQVRLKAGTAQAVFTLVVNVAIGSFTKVSGDGQTAVMSSAFGQPLVVEVKNDQGAAVAGAQVMFAVASGSATLGSPAAVTDSQGRASTTVTAGAAAGPVAITANVGGLTTTLNFNLTVVPPGPIVQLTGIRSAISGDLGVTPGGIVAIWGQGLAPGIQGSVVGNNMIGPLPTFLAGVEVLFGTTPAPIYHVNNVNGQESVVVQAPFGLAAPGTVNVTVKVGGGSTVVSNVTVKPYQPGIFETMDPGGPQYAVLLRPNGTYVSPTNRAQKGERIRMFLSGIGQTNPTLVTNAAGIAGQTVLAAPSIILGINYSGIPFVSAESMFGVVGVYVLTFDVPANAPSGLNIPLNMGILQSGGAQTIFSNTSGIHIQ